MGRGRATRGDVLQRMKWRETSRLDLNRRAPLARALLLAVLAMSVGACSLFKKDDNLPLDQPADKLYNEGVYLLDRKQSTKEAATKFEEVERQHPYSVWARKSLIMTAYAKYEAKEYDDAISAARRFFRSSSVCRCGRSSRTFHPCTTDIAQIRWETSSGFSVVKAAMSWR